MPREDVGLWWRLTPLVRQRFVVVPLASTVPPWPKFHCSYFRWVDEAVDSLVAFLQGIANEKKNKSRKYREVYMSEGRIE